MGKVSVGPAAPVAPRRLKVLEKHGDRRVDPYYWMRERNPEVVAHLVAGGVNTSLAMVAADGLRAYLRGEKERAVEDLSTVAEEIGHRMRASRATDKPS